MHRKRRYPRVALSTLTQLVLSEDDTLIQGYPFSAGFGGMGLYITRPIEIGQPVTAKVLLSLGNGQHSIATIPCVVRWCDTLGGMYRIGLEFRDLNPKEHGSFLAYLKTAKRWQ